MQVRCEGCGKRFDATRKTAKFCSNTCRSRTRRRDDRSNSQRQPAAQASSEAAPEEAGIELPLSLVAATLTELVKAGRENTPAGQAALLLAYRIERSHLDTGSSVAALVKQHSTTLAEAVKSAEKKSMVDELKKRRDAKRAG